jgi:hypothetical protein
MISEAAALGLPKARVLAGLDCDFAIRRPDELRGSVRALADRLAASS